jgi:uncharacterized tellurite resistance protein B-like protein
MIASIKSFFRKHVSAAPDDGPEVLQHRARVAAAALLVEVVRSDSEFSEVERAAVQAAARRKFGLGEEESRQLLELAEAQSAGAHDLYQFTSQVNAAFTAEEKVRLIEELWRVAWADNELHRYEEHLIRRVADLIYVPHSAFIATKLRVQDARRG